MAVTLASNAFVTVEEVVEFIFAHETVTDEDQDVLLRIVNGVCSAIESYCHNYFIIREGLSYTDDGGGDILLPHYPVIESSVTVTDQVNDDTVLVEGRDADYLVAYEDGVIIPIGTFSAGPQAILVEWSAGYGYRQGSEDAISIVDVPEDVRMAAMMWVRHIWKNEPTNYAPDTSFVIRPESIPSEVVKLLEPYVHHVGISG